jgi:hypothetical protein
MFESKSGVLLVAGLGFFALAFLSNAVVPIVMYADLPEKTVEQLLAEDKSAPGWKVLEQFAGLSERYPEQFKTYFPQARDNEEEMVKAAADALRLGRSVYVAEGCWHCHSQFIRPV